MPMVIPPGSYLAKLRWRLTGDPEEMICTLGFSPLEAETRTATELAQAVYDAWTEAWISDYLTSPWTFVGVDVVGSEGGTGAPSGSYDSVQTGTNSSGPLPQNCCILVKKKTNLSGQRNSGRMYLPGGYTSESDVTPAGALSPSELAKYTTAMGAFYLALTTSDIPTPPAAPGAGLRPELFHSVGDTAATEIVSFSVDPIIATQRQRLRR